MTTDTLQLHEDETQPSHFDRPPYFAGNEHEEGWDTETAKPGIALFGNAVQVWSIMNSNYSVADCAEAFNVPPDMVRQAVAWHYWMILDDDGETFQHEGE